MHDLCTIYYAFKFYDLPQIDVSSSCVCLVMDHEYRLNIVGQNNFQVAVDPTYFFDNVMMNFIVNTRTDA